MPDRRPAEVFPLGEYIQDELEARGWTTADCAARMGGDAALDELVLDLIIHIPDMGVLLDMETVRGLSRALGVPEQFLIDLDMAYRANASGPTPPNGV